MGTWSTCYAVPWRPGEARLGSGTRRPVLGVGWAASDPQPGSFLIWPGGVGPALVCSGLFMWPLTSLPWHRYVVESPRMPLSVSLKPPFLRPELLERAVPLKVKLSDNGLKAGRSKVGVWTGTKQMRVGLWGVWDWDRKR